MHTSELGHRLLCNCTPDVPTITVENYCKWYTLYVVHPDNRVELLFFPGYDNQEDVPESGVGFIDHVPNPKAVSKMAKRLGYDIDERSYECMVGRWFMETQNYGVVYE